MSTCAENEPYALQVTDSTMEPEFPKGCVIIVEPGGVLTDGCFVVGENDGEPVFRQLRMDAEGMRLCALQEGVDDIPLASKASIRGRVIQRAGRRRADRKHYLT